ncbi:glutaredoxin domain-containing protein [Cinnamomum micranthum f. kanehirae]|uniref:Glutaredoxin domain-containing protein n=1 Tax=Cinnamomum micranthum f. kanehirae TaxID=337451 RepID=A0A3S3QQT1_9MAGN|nr:glutaredoxin domain-containing protein [Cinnamomum micranthum f. kanehirae]
MADLCNKVEENCMENGDEKEKEGEGVSKDGSIHGFESLHHLLSASLKLEIFKEVSRLIVGLKCGSVVETVALPESAVTHSSKYDFDVQMIKRDISMDFGFREELRVLMEKEVRVPVVFVKGRLIGDADKVLKLEKEGELSFLLKGIPQATEVSLGCGGLF